MQIKVQEEMANSTENLVLELILPLDSVQIQQVQVVLDGMEADLDIILMIGAQEVVEAHIFQVSKVVKIFHMIGDLKIQSCLMEVNNLWNLMAILANLALKAVVFASSLVLKPLFLVSIYVSIKITFLYLSLIHI